MKNDCRRLHPLIERYLDGELDERDRRAVEQHIAGCPVAQREIAELSSLHELVARAEPAEPDEAFFFWQRRRVLNRLRHERRRRWSVRPAVGPIWLRYTAVLGGAALLVLVVFVGWRFAVQHPILRPSVAAPELTGIDTVEKPAIAQTRVPESGKDGGVGVRMPAEPKHGRPAGTGEREPSEQTVASSSPTASATAPTDVDRATADERLEATNERDSQGQVVATAAEPRRREKSGAVPPPMPVLPRRQRVSSVGPETLSRPGPGIAVSPKRPNENEDDRAAEVPAALVEKPSAIEPPAETGTAVVRVMIESDGRPSRIQLVRSSGSRAVDDYALRLARAAKYRPAQRGGRPHRAWLELPFTSSPKHQVPAEKNE